jgi:hypothetical protein
VVLAAEWLVPEVDAVDDLVAFQEVESSLEVPPAAAVLAVVEALVVVGLVAAVDETVPWTAMAPVMARKAPALTPAATLRAWAAGWGRLRRGLGGEVGSAGM